MDFELKSNPVFPWQPELTAWPVIQSIHTAPRYARTVFFEDRLVEQAEYTETLEVWFYHRLPKKPLEGYYLSQIFHWQGT
jgi:hypothetical protein